MKGRIDRICFDGSNRQSKFIVPCVVDALSQGRVEQANRFALVSVLWCYYCRGTTESGEEIAPNDPDWNSLQAKARKTWDSQDPSVWLAMEHVYGTRVGTDISFADMFRKWLALAVPKASRML